MREGTSGRERTHNPVVVGSSPTRPTHETDCRNGWAALGHRIPPLDSPQQHYTAPHISCYLVENQTHIPEKNQQAHMKWGIF